MRSVRSTVSHNAHGVQHSNVQKKKKRKKPKQGRRTSEEERGRLCVPKPFEQLFKLVLKFAGENDDCWTGVDGRTNMTVCLTLLPSTREKEQRV